jgi:Flp pilus assembly protein TadG
MIARRRLSVDRRGSVSVEFAIWTIVIFFGFLPVLDFADYLIEEQNISTAVTDAALIAYDQRNATTLNTSQITTYVTGSTGLGTGQISATLTCNGGLQPCSTAAPSRTCACVSGSPATFTASTCGSTCASGAQSGFYLTVQATHTHTSLVVNPWLNGAIITSATTVRLQ